MCGIFGSASAGSIRFQDSSTARAVATLTHRGPDDEGIWLSSDRTVALGHRRLSIIDLSPGGHQPKASADGEIVLVFNGEIYNYRTLRDQLRAAGSSFTTESDTEVVIEAYRHWGLDCVQHFDGMFAFALFDRRRKHIFAARDRAGEKPFYFRVHGQALYFASELKALMADPTMVRAMDPHALNAYLTYGFVPRDQCILRGVQKLLPAHALLFGLEDASLTIHRYWDLPIPNASRPMSDEEATDECARLLGESVRLRMVADVPVGVLLSGGVDSSLVTAFAARCVPSLKTFTVSFPGHARFDEAPFARLVANHFGTEHTELPGEEASVALLPLLARQFDEPLADHSIIPTFLVSRLIRSHATVALGGDGGDELFGGYPHYELIERITRMQQRVPAFIRRPASAMAARLPLGTRGRNHLIGFGGSAKSVYSHINVYFDRTARRALLTPQMWELLDEDAPERARASLLVPGLSAMQNATRLDFLTTMPDDYLVKVDRASMLSALEVRAPFLDHKLIEFAFAAVPDRLRAIGGERKVILRRLASQLLPPELDLRRKQGFSLPLASWFQGEWGTFAREVLLDSSVGLFQTRAVERLFALQARGYANANRLFALLMLELWRREYGIAIPDGPSA